MSIFPGEKLGYAETHFKFKLPWSLLYRPWPEVIFDAPFQFVPGVEPFIYLVVRDAHQFPTHIEDVEVAVKVLQGQSTNKLTNIYQLNIPMNVTASKPFAFYTIPLKKLDPGKYFIEAKAKLRKKNGAKKVITRWNLPGLKKEYLQINILQETPPLAPGFVVGEMHCHTHYSADHVEFGATPQVLQQTAKAIGLDFVNCTDHAYDFFYSEEDYTKKNSVPRFSQFQKEIEKLNNGNSPLMLSGEEVSVGNHMGENVHMTAFSPTDYLSGLGDCGRNWLNNKPTFRIEQVLAQTEAPCFAAHPKEPMGFLERFVFRRGYWSHQDLHIKEKNPIRGIQFWNGVRDEGFFEGKKFWIEELGKENYILPIGGNDAHGDLNDTTKVAFPLFTLKHNRHHIFGQVRTGIFVGEEVGKSIPLSKEILQNAFASKNGNCFVTNGPALWWSPLQNNRITFHAKSTEDLGIFRYIRIYGRRRLPSGKLSSKEELHLDSVVAAPRETSLNVNVEDFAYLRAECETEKGHFALTSACVLKGF
ncbi:MAG: hypothetical protein HUK21_04690 [Fibrobacteraceae bacterium]|nr:hypothetical protein [Fibrobacteraceae bacterium]